MTSEFYHQIPKEPWGNIRFRQWIVAKCATDPKFAKEIWSRCARDILFYINVFGNLLEPRPPADWKIDRPFASAKEIPFITRPYQDKAILAIAENLGRRDILILKSREMGATWMVLYVFDWAWRFHNQQHFGLVSKDEASVDKADDPDSLMAKLDFIEAHLPPFLQPGGNSKTGRKRSVSEHTLLNRTNNSSVTGYACTGDVARGGRKLAFFMDEIHSYPAGGDVAAMASTQHVCQCRILCSTPNPQRGQAGVFYDVAQDLSADVVRIVLDWKNDADKSRGLYTSEGNDLKIIDKTYPFTSDYKFVLDGKTRSPYYDYECRRPAATNRSIAAELDMDFGGATNRFFDPTVITLMDSTTMTPVRASLRRVYDEWLPVLYLDEHGDIELWNCSAFEFKVSDDGLGNVIIPKGWRFAIGADISQGTGGSFSSYSAMVIFETSTGEQVGEWRSNKTMPVDMAYFTLALGMTFNNALLCPEITGVGQQFLVKMLELQYPNFWMRPRTRDSIARGQSLKPGIDNKDGGLVILGELQRACKAKECTIRSKRIVMECQRYFTDENAKLRHPLVGKGRVDSPEKSHGDSAIAGACAWWAIHEEPEETPEEQELEAPYGGFAWRRKQYVEDLNKNPSYWNPLIGSETGYG